MFIYEKGNSLNLTFKGSIPVENPEVIIEGYENGAELTVNGTKVVSVSNAKAFEGKASTLVFQANGKLMITFRGIKGIENPEVTLDEVSAGVVEAVVNGTSVALHYTDNSVTVGDAVAATHEEEDLPVTDEPNDPESNDEGDTGEEE